MSLKYTLDFTDKTVIITGAAGGLGLTLAQAFFANNANVVITDVSDERLAAAPGWFLEQDAGVDRGEQAARFLAVKCDSSSESEVAALMETVVARFGALDVLVNNAAVNDDLEPTGEVGMDMWEKNIKVWKTGF
jgi:NAD(P)-dependent dehydrogenase (short-subunit alcohol dehydrogenase family)